MEGAYSTQSWGLFWSSKASISKTPSGNRKLFLLLSHFLHLNIALNLIIDLYLWDWSGDNSLLLDPRDKFLDILVCDWLQVLVANFSKSWPLSRILYNITFHL